MEYGRNMQPNVVPAQSGGIRNTQDVASQVGRLDGQIAAVLAMLFGSALTVIVLLGTQDRLLDRFPGRDYGYLASLPRASGLIFLLTSVYYFYDTLDQRRESPGQRSLDLLLGANFLAMAASAIKFWLILDTPAGENASLEAQEELDLDLL